MACTTKIERQLVSEGRRAHAEGHPATPPATYQTGHKLAWLRGWHEANGDERSKRDYRE